VQLDSVLELGEAPVPFDDPSLGGVADAIATAVRAGAPVVLMIGAHLVKRGLSRYLCDLIRKGWITVVAGNGACVIHDFELASVGATSESVAENILDGSFGHWAETGRLNEIVTAGRKDGLGLGEAVGRYVSQSDLPHKDVSIYASAYESSAPATVHVGIGYDIIHQHPNCDGAALGEASHRDFLIFAKTIENLEGGVLLCYGTAVMGPEVFLKALSMARNVANSEGRTIRCFTSAVFDIVDLPEDLSGEVPDDRPEYYYRPFKTILVRTVQDGGRSYYIRGDHLATLPALHRLLAERMED
jgi:hypothetical protein